MVIATLTDAAGAAGPIIVPMTVIDTNYFDEIIGGCAPGVSMCVITARSRHRVLSGGGCTPGRPTYPQPDPPSTSTPYRWGNFAARTVRR